MPSPPLGPVVVHDDGIGGAGDGVRVGGDVVGVEPLAVRSPALKKLRLSDLERTTVADTARAQFMADYLELIPYAAGGLALQAFGGSIAVRLAEAFIICERTPCHGFYEDVKKIIMDVITTRPSPPRLLPVATTSRLPSASAVG